MLIKYMSDNVKAKSDIGNMTIDFAVKLYPAVQKWLDQKDDKGEL